MPKPSELPEGWPKEKTNIPEREDFTGNCDDDYNCGWDIGNALGFNEALSLCTALHLRAMEEKDREIAELKASIEVFKNRIESMRS